MNNFIRCFLSILFASILVSTYSQQSDQFTLGGAGLHSTWQLSQPSNPSIPWDHTAVTTKDKISFYFGYSHRFNNPLALDFSVLKPDIAFVSEKVYFNKDSSNTVNVEANLLSFCMQYHFAGNPTFDPYIGLGVNLMGASHSSKYVAYYRHAGGFYAVANNGGNEFGWLAQAGVNIALSKHLGIKCEGQYIRNRLLVSRFRWYSGDDHLQYWMPMDTSYLRVNPVVTLFGVWVRW